MLAPGEFTEKYLGVYDAGWDALREQRRARAVELGIVAPDTEMVRMSTTDDWDAYTREQQRYHAKRMAVYAGMVDAMDHHLRRLVQYLKDIGQYSNTIFIFSSDNGAEASGGDDVRSPLMRLSLEMGGYTNDYDTLGEKGSFNSIGPSFASAAVGPLAYYKFYAGEGGLRVPLIIAGDALPVKNQWTHAFAWVTDITPTILKLTGVTDRVYGESESIGYELAGNAALFQGDYKIVRNRPPVGDDLWHLYNIVTDPGETRDLAREMPDRLQQMLEQYQNYATENQVLAVPAHYGQSLQGVYNGIRKRYTPQLLLVIATLLVLLPFYIAYRIVRK